MQCKCNSITIVLQIDLNNYAYLCTSNVKLLPKLIL